MFHGGSKVVSKADIKNKIGDSSSRAAWAADGRFFPPRPRARPPPPPHRRAAGYQSEVRPINDVNGPLEWSVPRRPARPAAGRNSSFFPPPSQLWLSRLRPRPDPSPLPPPRPVRRLTSPAHISGTSNTQLLAARHTNCD